MRRNVLPWVGTSSTVCVHVPPPQSSVGWSEMSMNFRSYSALVWSAGSGATGGRDGAAAPPAGTVETSVGLTGLVAEGEPTVSGGLPLLGAALSNVAMIREANIGAST